jgi:hypothetical protein
VARKTLVSIGITRGNVSKNWGELTVSHLR